MFITFGPSLFQKVSYDLAFWKYKNGIYLDNKEVYEQCSDGQIVSGLERLPIESITKDIQREFYRWKMEESDIDFNNPDGDGAFHDFGDQGKYAND